LKPFAQLDRDGLTDTLTYLHPDHLNTPRIATSSTGTVVWAWKSDAAGSFAPYQDPDGDGNLTTINLRYAGQYFDSEDIWGQDIWGQCKNSCSLL
jgi:uncharacterized protein RhaS with RHS repeats